MIYGIDLGTTNSLVSKYNSETDTVENLSPLVPSFVNMVTQEVGTEQRTNLINMNKDIVSSYKINISESSSGKISVFASSCVLSELSKYMTESKDVVITVPAYFHNDQRSATKKAAEAAGLNVRALINEPTAAAMYFSKGRPGKFVVYDLGGGTFDVTVIDTSFGISDVQSTDGIKLGGDDLNRAIYEYLLNKYEHKRHLFEDNTDRSMIEQCEIIKRFIQQNHTNGIIELSESLRPAFEVDRLELTPDEYRSIVYSTFGKTIRIMSKVVKNSGYPLSELKLLLVGGSTRDPYLRDIIADYKQYETTDSIYNPDTVVAMGAAYYAYLIEQGLDVTMVSDITKGIGIEMSNGTTLRIIEPSSKLPISNNVLVTNPNRARQLTLRIVQGNDRLARNNYFIGDLLYNFREEKEAQQGLILLSISVSPSGVITAQAREPLGKQEVISLNVN
jgi:molecular chaperone DnaK (HSP70)